MNRCSMQHEIAIKESKELVENGLLSTTKECF